MKIEEERQRLNGMAAVIDEEVCALFNDVDFVFAHVCLRVSSYICVCLWVLVCVCVCVLCVWFTIYADGVVLKCQANRN